MQYSMVNLYGPYAEDKASHLETTGPIDFDFTVRYRFYTQDASYYAFAGTIGSSSSTLMGSTCRTMTGPTAVPPDGGGLHRLG